MSSKAILEWKFNLFYVYVYLFWLFFSAFGTSISSTLFLKFALIVAGSMTSGKVKGLWNLPKLLYFSVVIFFLDLFIKRALPFNCQHIIFNIYGYIKFLFFLFFEPFEINCQDKMRVNLQLFNLLVALIYELYNTLYVVFIIRNLQTHFLCNI